MVLTPSAAGGRAERLEPADGAGECGAVHRPCPQRYRCHLEKNAAQMPAISRQLTTIASQHAVRLDVPLKVEVGVELCGSQRLVVTASKRPGDNQRRSQPAFLSRKQQAARALPAVVVAVVRWSRQAQSSGRAGSMTSFDTTRCTNCVDLSPQGPWL